MSNATLMTAEQVSQVAVFCVYSVAEAAQKLGVSETTVRVAAKKLGVERIAGPVVAGFVAWANGHGQMTVVMPYAA